MRREWFGSWVALGLLILGASPAWGFDDDDEIALARVPAIVKDAAQQALPGASWVTAYRETERGQTIYELEGQDGQGRKVSVFVTEQGRVRTVHTIIPVAEVPRVVVAALHAKVPEYRVVIAYSIARDGVITAYEFEGQIGDGPLIEARVNANGMRVVVQER
jgi:hypothetical protein